MNSARVIKVAAAQLSPVLSTESSASSATSSSSANNGSSMHNSRDGTIAKVVAAIAAAARAGAQLIVFPETVVPYYPYFSFITPAVTMGAEHLKLYEQAVTVPSAATDAVAAAAKKYGMVVVLGVNERDHGSLYNAQLIFDASGELLLKRRKITPTYHERMVWGQGDGSGLKTVDTAVGRVGALACWEHYNPLARYSLMAQHEEIHCSQFPGSLVGPIFAEQMEITMRHHALESGCFVVNATAWLTDAQIISITADPALQKALRGGCYTAIISPEGKHLCEPLREGEGLIVAELDFALITKRKRMMDSVGHYARPELLSLLLDNRETTPLATTQSTTATNSLGTNDYEILRSVPHEPVRLSTIGSNEESNNTATDHRDSIARVAPG